VPPKGEEESCGFDAEKEGKLLESSPAMMPNADEFDVEGLGAAPTGSDTEGLAVDPVEPSGLGTLYFLANLANISTSRP
jgi:hypothetical protein